MDLWQQFREAQDKTSKLKKSNSVKDHEKVLQLLIEAGNQVGVFDGVFSQLDDASDAFKRYIVAKVAEHQFYRYKCVVDGIAYGFGLDYPIKDSKKFVSMVNDILSGDYGKYLASKEITVIHTLLSLLYLVDDKAYKRYFDDALISTDKYKRFIAFYFVSRRRKDKLAICNSHFDQEDLEIYAPLLDCIPSYYGYNHKEKKHKPEGNGKTEEALFYKLCQLYNRLPQKKILYKTNEDIWFPHSVGKEEINTKIFYLLDVLKDKQLIRYYEDNYYEALSPKEKIEFINLFRTYLRLDYRREMLNYFSYKDAYYLGENQSERYFLSNPLTYDEAVIVSGLLKTKKNDVKKHIVEHFQKMSDKDKSKLKDYLQQSPEEYRQEAAKDLGIIKNQNTAAEAPAITSAAKLPKVTVQNMPEARVIDCFIKLKDFVKSNKDYQYKAFNGQDELFGSSYLRLNNDDEYPLQNESNALIKSFLLTDDELVYFNYALLQMQTGYSYRFDTTTVGRKVDEIAASVDNKRLALQYFIPMLKGFIKQNNTAGIQKAAVYRIITVMGAIKVPADTKEDYTPWGTPEEEKKPEPLWLKLQRTASELNSGISYGLLDKETLSVYAEAIQYAHQSPEASKKIFSNSQEAFSYLHDLDIIPQDKLFALLKEGIMDISRILAEPNEHWPQAFKSRYLFCGKYSKEYIDLIERVVMFMLDTEIRRSQAETPYTKVIADCQKLFGIKYYLTALQAFQKMSLPRSSYSWSTTKDNVFANIVQSCLPYKTDTYESFSALVKELKLTEKDLIKGALFNNNWTILDWTDKYLGKKGFVSTVMFFKAHLRDTEVSKSVQDKIALYSPIDILDFKEGAVDVDWFWNIKREADEATFNLIYDNAKYITVANYHKRAQRFHDALTGKLTKEECLERIKETRNKEFILYYSLVPHTDERDIEERYGLIMQFLQQSKQFGAQRQASEKKASEVALENLARISGYDDADRFVWYMESKSADRIAQFFVPKQIEDALVFLSISDRFKVAVSVEKNGKELASIPSKIKSDPYLALLKAEVPILNKQSSRVIKSLEAAMEGESKFTADELRTIAKNPLIMRILSCLFYKANGMILTFAELIDLQEAECIIAHPLDLYQQKVWQEKQKYLLSHQIRQPFKQAFRELYPKTDDEKYAKETNRYQGHQISVQKAIAVAKGRGWHSGEDIGLQKVFYKQNIVAVLFGIWDYGYSSFDDHPTLSSIFFLDRKTLEIIPLDKVNDKMFSEVMRDVDLIVSTSHPQGYDFEESLSTVEVRKQICQNIAELLNLQNVSVVGNFIKIAGTMGGYTVNLRSAVASKELSGALNIMAINDSTHNKLFINVIDDNPITVEVISKMLLLSDDTKIKDPNIIRELKR